jgi:hypothetical protein
MLVAAPALAEQAVEGGQRVLAEVIGMAIEEGIALPGFVLAVFGVVGLGIIRIDAAVAHR